MNAPILTGKLGRNDPCACGSGKKYKKCCIDRAFESEGPETHAAASSALPMLGTLEAPEKIAIIHTTTGEPFMPARLYYRIHDKPKLMECLRRLRCAATDDEEEIFDLSYWHEAKNLGLSVRYNRVPEELFPIILASCHIRGEEMTVDTRSFERAWRILLFLDRHIGRKIAEVTDVATYNRIEKREVTTVDEIMSWDYDTLFSAEAFQENPSLLLPDDDEFETLSTEDQAAWNKKLDESLHAPLPRVSKTRVHFYEDGIHDLKSFLNLRMIMAGVIERTGKEGTLLDALKMLAENLSPEPQDEEDEAYA